MNALKGRLSLLLCFATTHLFCQITYSRGFADYLITSNLKSEFEYYIDNLKWEEDSSIYYFENARLKFQQGDLESALFMISHLEKIENADSSFVNSLVLASLPFEDFHNQIEALKKLDTFVLSRSTALIQLLRDDSLADELLTTVWEQEAFERIRRVRNKTNFGIVWRSLIIPAWGRSYFGKSNEFKNSFIVPTFFGVQFAEAIAKLGLMHPYTIVMGIGFQIFYIGELAGGIKSKRDYEFQLQKQFLIDEANYMFYRTH